MRVLVLDRVAAGPKIGEALPGAASRLLARNGLPVPSVGDGHWRLTGTLSAWGDDALEGTDFLRDPDGPGWRLERARFDAGLRIAAQEAGAVLHPARLRAVEAADDGWRITADDGTAFQAARLVDATGRAAAVARRLGARRLREDDLVAVYGVGRGAGASCLARTLVEARPEGWWYAARLPAGGVLASFQVRAAEARRLLDCRAQPTAWLEAVQATLHVRAALADVTFADRPRAVEAGSARSSCIGGEGWIACGDAALAFDPISGQGLFSALYGGVLAAGVLLAPEGQRGTRLAAYIERHAAIRRAYRHRYDLTYAAEQRWPDLPFWASRTGRVRNTA
ncbi:hypothetical protein [Methylobacterium sp.]|uniref:hypothetical protein n=1 Tax=Methylobacterium sp. TaxID=409 RepID=UPI000C5A95D2|nr:hypothetical protein [Methylobacterium sp.]MBP33163.1 oxidoreductase [Methylobacterium sp.]